MIRMCGGQADAGSAGMVRTVASATGAGEVEVLLLDPVLPHSKVRSCPFIDQSVAASLTPRRAGRPSWKR
jgi:hypothetical protein